MGSIDRVDDRTFRVNFSGDGANRLREKVNEKLKEYMGDYTDDTLVEYVIVLLKNGRSKEEARNELNVFLGDDSDSFVSWLWDDLASNFDLYVQPQESCEGEATIIKSKLGDQQENNEFHHVESESDRGKSHKEQRVRHHREWKGLARDAAEPPPLRSSEVESIYADRKTHRRTSHARRSPSPRSAVQKKRRWPDEQEIMKRESAQGNIDAPRRLLQFAVRDAVAMSRPSISATEPSLKRLRSVVSTSTGDSSLVDHPRRLQSVARVPNPMATVIKAVAEASEDVKKVKTSGSVFDRLGRGMDVSETVVDQLASYGGATTEDGEYVDVYQNHEQTRSTYFKRSDHRGQYVGDETVLENGTGLASDSMSENEGYDDVNICSVTDVSQTVTSAINRVENPLMMQYSVAKNSDDTKRVVRNKDHAQPSVAANNSQKIVNISVNVNTWKPPHYQEPREVANVDGWKSAQEGQGVASKSGMRVMKENSNPVAVNGNEKLNAETQKESQKIVSSATGLYAAGRPLEDADSRTLFVTNVHFAATKDSLSRHFNKFGDVLKVVIITDPATGQPIGSAYVEFMRKEAADNALSLDGTSFMSRILKVVRRSAAHQETAPPSMTWPRARGSTFATPRFPGVPFPRGLSSSFRPRPLIKPGARSMQWKRDAQPSPGESGAPLTGNVVPSPTSRSLTYVRPESKPETKSGTT
ncbi:hypothetical protein UlMin_007216 [Ulmus minor]